MFWSGWIITFNQKVLMYAYNPKLICTLPIQISNRLVIYEVEMSVHPKYYSFKETLPLQLHLVYKTHFTVGQGSKLLVNWILMDTSRQHHDYSKHQSWSRDASHFSLLSGGSFTNVCTTRHISCLMSIIIVILAGVVVLFYSYCCWEVIHW